MSAVDDREKERTITIVNAEGVIQGKPMVVVSQTGLSRWLDNLGYITLVDFEDPKGRQLDDYYLLKKDGKYTLGARKQGISPTEQPPSQQPQQPQQHELAEKGFKTSATRRNGQEIQSPGSILDAVEDDDESKLLLAARKFCQAKTEMGMKIPEVAKLRQPPELKDFTKVNLPHTRGKIDMRISFAPEWPATPVGKQLCDLMNSEYPPPGVILVGKSGCGKTSAIFEAAQEKFCILFTASWNDEHNLASRSDPGGFDDSFSEGLVSDVSDVIASEDTTPARQKCEHLILAFIVARMLLLWTFTEDAADKSPLSWLMYQLTQDMHDRTQEMYNSLAKRPKKVLRNLKRALAVRLDFFFAFDEIQLATTYLRTRSSGRARPIRRNTEVLLAPSYAN